MKKKTHEEFEQELYLKNQYFRNGEFLIVSEYNTMNSAILIKDKYGVISSKPYQLLKGIKPSIECAVDKTKYFLERLKKENPVIFSEIITIDTIQKMNSKVKIQHKYGYSLIPPSEILSLRGISFPMKSSVDKNEYFLLRIKTIREDYETIDYSKFEYTSRGKAIFKCKKHEYEYHQRPNEHTEGVQGCIYCMKSTIRYTEDTLKEHKDFFESREGILYILRLSNDNESFYKIGITGRDKKYRYKTYSRLYNIEEVYTEKGKIVDLFRIEQLFLSEFRDYSYSPKRSFKGQTECLTINPIHAYYDEYIRKQNIPYEVFN